MVHLKDVGKDEGVRLVLKYFCLLTRDAIGAVLIWLFAAMSCLGSARVGINTLVATKKYLKEIPDFVAGMGIALCGPRR